MLLSRIIQTRLGRGPHVLRKTSAGILMVRRWMTQTLSFSNTNPRTLFIFGCQRSGTTLLSRIFEGDATVCSFAEHSRLLSKSDHRLRTRSLPELERVFGRCRGKLIVAKPLVESQRATAFLDHFPDSLAIWSFRHYRDVARSFVKLFGSAGVNIMKKVVDGADNWAAESVSEESKALVARFYRPDMAQNDAAALVWLLRNALFFEQQLDTHPRVSTCVYADLVSRPNETMRRIYAFVKLPYPGEHLTGGVHEDSRGLGRSLRLDPEIESLCDAMWRRLNAAHARITEPAATQTSS